MKLGLILECPKGGTDEQVYRHVITTLCPNWQLEVIPSGTNNKPDLIDKCGDIAQLLLTAEHCDEVAIIWDLMPTWGGKACRKNDVAAIHEHLVQANVPLDKVKLSCIEPELESWFLVDERVLTTYKKEESHPHPVQKFKKKVLRRHSNKAKATISNYLGRRYNDTVEALKIVQQIMTYDCITRRHASFRRLKTYIEAKCS